MTKFFTTTISACLLVVSSAAYSAPLYEVALSNLVFNGGPYFSDTSPLTKTGLFTMGNHTTFTGAGYAGNGNTTNELVSTITSTSSITGNARQWTRFTFDDLTFYDINNPLATGSIDVSASMLYNIVVGDPGDLFKETFYATIKLGGNQVTTGETEVLTSSLTDSLSTGVISVNLLEELEFSVYTAVETAYKTKAIGTSVINMDTCAFGCSFSLPDGYGVKTAQGAFDSAAVVPLPTAVWLFGSALLGLAAVKRCKA